MVPLVAFRKARFGLAVVALSTVFMTPFVVLVLLAMVGLIE